VYVRIIDGCLENQKAVQQKVLTDQSAGMIDDKADEQQVDDGQCDSKGTLVARVQPRKQGYQGEVYDQVQHDAQDCVGPHTPSLIVPDTGQACGPVQPTGGSIDELQLSPDGISDGSDSSSLRQVLGLCWNKMSSSGASKTGVHLKARSSRYLGYDLICPASTHVPVVEMPLLSGRGVASPAPSWVSCRIELSESGPGVRVGVTPGASVGVMVAVGVTPGASAGVAVAVDVCRGVRVGSGVRVVQGITIVGTAGSRGSRVGDVVAVGALVAVAVPVAVLVGAQVGVAVGVAVAVGVSTSVAVGVGGAVPPRTVGLGPPGVMVGVSVGNGTAVGVGIKVDVGVCVGGPLVGRDVGVAVGDDVAVAVGDGVDVGGIGVAVEVGGRDVAVEDGIGSGVGVGVDVGDGVAVSVGKAVDCGSGLAIDVSVGAKATMVDGGVDPGGKSRLNSQMPLFVATRTVCSSRTRASTDVSPRSLPRAIHVSPASTDMRTFPFLVPA